MGDQIRLYEHGYRDQNGDQHIVGFDPSYDGYRHLRPKWYWYPVQVLTSFAFYFGFFLPGIILSPLAVAIGVWTMDEKHDFPRWLYWWDNIKDNTDGKYYDGWWDKPKNYSMLFGLIKWHGLHWSWKLGDRFAEWYWRVMRNPFSNGKRFVAVGSGEFVRIKSHLTLKRPKGSQAFAGVPDGTKWAWVYAYDMRKPWYAYVRACRFATPTKDRYLQLYQGFKVDRKDGMGHTAFRTPFPRNEDA